jgi:hypothetical protein
MCCEHESVATLLCEAAWIVITSPSPLRAFGERIAARRGSRMATVAVARKLGGLGGPRPTAGAELRCPRDRVARGPRKAAANG